MTEQAEHARIAERGKRQFLGAASKRAKATTLTEWEAVANEALEGLARMILAYETLAWQVMQSQNDA